MLGIITVLLNKNIINTNELKNVYGTSGGSIIGALLCLDVDFETINNYFINRPWGDLIDLSLDNIYNIYKSKGIIESSFLNICFKPLLSSKNLSPLITLKELFDYSHITLYIYTFELNNFETIEMSHKTHPNLMLYEAIYMSCSIPCVFEPLYKQIDNTCNSDDKLCYIDGGIMNNYPLNECLNHNNDPLETLGIRIKTNNNTIITNETNIIEYATCLIMKLVKHVNTNRLVNREKIKHEIIFNYDINHDSFIKVFSNVELRNELFSEGEKCSLEYIDNIKDDEVIVPDETAVVVDVVVDT
jgi:predicted acylesterase/phospholipase RssA